MRFWIIFTAALFLWASASHAEPIAGQSCAGYPANAIMQSSGASANGSHHMLTCVSNVWAATPINPGTIPGGTEPIPGDSCSGYPDNAVMRAGGPQRAGALFTLICNAGQWRLPGTTIVQDNTPDAFAFTLVNDAMLDEEVLSNIVTITGIGPAPVPVRITNPNVDWAPMFRIDGGEWVQEGTISNGQTLQLYVYTSATAAAPPALYLNPAAIAVGKTAATPPADFIRTWLVRVLRERPPGTVMPDGTIYAGMTPDGNVPMYTTPTDVPSTYTWNNGSASSYDVTALENCQYNELACTTGKQNTSILAQQTIGQQPYRAAKYCNDLVANDRSDWYLPAAKEMEILSANQASIPDLKTTSGAAYWTSSEQNAWYAVTGVPYYNANSYADKYTLANIRCVRTDFALSIANVTNSLWNTSIESSVVTLSGVGPYGADLTLSGEGIPQMRINGGAWVTSATVYDGQTIQLRLNSANAASVTRTASILIARYNETDMTSKWTVTTNNNSPAFAFTNITSANYNTLTESDGVIISGIGPATTTMSVSGEGSPQIRINWGTWVTSGTIKNDDVLQVRLTAAPTASTTRQATTVVGNASVIWSVRTKDIFGNIQDVTNAGWSALTESNTVTIAGMVDSSLPITISPWAGSSPQLRINNGAWTTSGTIKNGDTLQVRLTSAGTASTTTSGTLTAGSTSRRWNVTTRNNTIYGVSCPSYPGNYCPANTVYTTTSSVLMGPPSATASLLNTSANSAMINVNGAGWTTSATIKNGDSVTLRLNCPSKSSITNFTLAYSGGASSSQTCYFMGQ